MKATPTAALAALAALAAAAGCKDGFPVDGLRIDSTTVLSADVAPLIDETRTYEYDSSQGRNDSLLIALWQNRLAVSQAWYPVDYMCEDARGARLTVELAEADDARMATRDFRPGTGRLQCSEDLTRYVIVEPPAGGFIVDATVEFLDLEGGCWRLTQADGIGYEPLSLPDDFRQHGLAVRATLRLRTDLASICQVGPIAEVLAIERR